MKWIIPEPVVTFIKVGLQFHSDETDTPKNVNFYVKWNTCKKAHKVGNDGCNLFDNWLEKCLTYHTTVR
jgi:hypothetical protein